MEESSKRVKFDPRAVRKQIGNKKLTAQNVTGDIVPGTRTEIEQVQSSSPEDSHEH